MHAPSLTIRASSFAGLFDCALRWEGIHLLKLTAPSSPRALIGSGVHVGSAAFDQARIDHRTLSISDAVDAAQDEVTRRIAEEPVQWSPDEPNRREVESLVTRMTHRYCRDISPRYEFESVELSTNPMDIDVGGVVIRLTGTLDRARTILTPGLDRPKRRLGDLKTGRAAVNAQGVAHTKKHKAQLGTYELLYEHTTGQAIDDGSEILGLNSTGNLDFGTGRVLGAKALLLGPEHGYPGLLELAAHMAKTGLYPPNPQSALCGAKYCPRYSTCPYADH